MTASDYRLLDEISSGVKAPNPPQPQSSAPVLMATSPGYTVHRFDPYYPKGITESSDMAKAHPAQLVELAAECGSPTDEAHWQAELDRAVKVRSLWEGDRLVGFGLMMEEDGKLILDRAFVHPRYQNTGLFRTLLGKVMVSAATDHPHRLYIRADADRVLFYQRLGWREMPSNTR